VCTQCKRVIPCQHEALKGDKRTDFDGCLPRVRHEYAVFFRCGVLAQKHAEKAEKFLGLRKQFPGRLMGA